MSDTRKEIMDFELYAAARSLANVVFACIQAENSPYFKKMEDRRNEPVDPYHFVTESGLFLKFMYDMPIAILTPFGEWMIIGNFYEGIDSDYVRKSLLKNIESRIGMTLYSELKNDKGVVAGHVYAVHEVGGVILPESKGSFSHNHVSLAFIVEAEEAWRKHTARYFEEMSQKK